MGAAAIAVAAPGRTPAAAGGATILNDASRLDATRVKRHWRPPPDDAGFIDGLRRELKDAAAAGRPVIAAGARHSMGGQSLPRDGTAITLDTGWRRADPSRGVYQARSGARWREIIQTLRPAGFSPKVMQANNDFTLGGAFSVNAHGWATPMGPVGSSVRSLRLMLADGEIVTCSRTLEPELFGLTMGGYGLFGVLLDFEMEMVPDINLRPSVEQMPGSGFGPRFQHALHQPGVTMGYGRLSIAHRDFLRDANMVTFHVAPGHASRTEGGGNSLLSGLARDIYRAQVGSEAWKRARWYAETAIDPALEPKLISRNDLLNTPVSALASRDASRTDILHEYFLPPDRLGDFVQAARDVILKARVELLNVTLRYIDTDHFSVLAFAPAPRVAAVMSFSVPLDALADLAMRPMTQALIDQSLAHGGSFYLPYRLQARRDQLDRAYPKLATFLEAKRRYDPATLFRNALWDHYFA